MEEEPNKIRPGDELHINGHNKNTENHDVISRSFIGSVVIVAHNNTDNGDSTVPKAPDGGWAWVVLVMSFICCAIVGFMIIGNNVLYVSLVEYFQVDRGTGAWVTSLYSFTGNACGILFGAFIKQYGCRTTGICGGLIGAVGLSFAYFLVNIPYLCVFVGVFAGMANTLTLMTSFVAVQQYFDKRRVMAIGFASSGISVGVFVSPPVFRALLATYSLSGTYLIAAGIWLQLVVLSTSFRPLKDSQPKQQTQKYKQSEQLKHMLKDSIDFTILKNQQVVMFLISVFLYHCGSMSFSAHFLSRTVYLGIPHSQAITLQTILGLSACIARFLCSLLGLIPSIKREYLFSIMLILGAIVVLTFPVAKSPISIGVYGIGYGITSGCYFCFQQAILVDVGGIANVAKVTGMFLLSVGVSMLISIPFVGYILDISGSYDLPFYVVGFLNLCGAGLVLSLTILRETKWMKQNRTSGVT